MAERPVLSCNGRWMPVVQGVLALLIGLLIYLADRPAGHALLIPASWSWHGAAPIFGAAGDWLPSALHSFAFSLLTAAAWPPRATVAAPCLLWWCIDVLAEISQHPTVSASLVAALAPLPGLNLLGRYALHGTFDVADLAAITVGTLAAALLLSQRPFAEVLREPS